MERKSGASPDEADDHLEYGVLPSLGEAVGAAGGSPQHHEDEPNSLHPAVYGTSGGSSLNTSLCCAVNDRVRHGPEPSRQKSVCLCSAEHTSISKVRHVLSESESNRTVKACECSQRAVRSTARQGGHWNNRLLNDMQYAQAFALRKLTISSVTSW